jgi:hypothetical protein
MACALEQHRRQAAALGHEFVHGQHRQGSWVGVGQRSGLV